MCPEVESASWQAPPDAGRVSGGQHGGGHRGLLGARMCSMVRSSDQSFTDPGLRIPMHETELSSIRGNLTIHVGASATERTHPADVRTCRTCASRRPASRKVASRPW